MSKSSRVGLVVPARNIPEDEVNRFKQHLTESYPNGGIELICDASPAPGLFNLSREINRGLRQLLMRGCDTIGVGSIDLAIPPKLLQEMPYYVEPGKSLWIQSYPLPNGQEVPSQIPVGAIPQDDNLTGLTFLSAVDWLRVGGYDERVLDRGHESYLLYTKRLSLGWPIETMSHYPLFHWEHPVRDTWCRLPDLAVRTLPMHPSNCNYLTVPIAQKINNQSLYVHITTNCENDCTYCAGEKWRHDNAGYFMDLEEAELLRDVIEHSANPPSTLVITGGEPLYHPGLEAILSIFRTIPEIKIELLTSGLPATSLTKEIAQIVDKVRITERETNKASLDDIREVCSSKCHVVQSDFYPVPYTNQMDTLPTTCQCPGLGYFNRWVYACPNLPFIFADKQMDRRVTAGLTEPIGVDFTHLRIQNQLGRMYPCETCVCNENYQLKLGGKEVKIR